jgi:hypothetical protein
LQFTQAKIGNHDTSALSRQGKCGGPTNPRTPTSDESDLFLESAPHVDA